MDGFLRSLIMQVVMSQSVALINEKILIPLGRHTPSRIYFSKFL